MIRRRSANCCDALELHRGEGATVLFPEAAVDWIDTCTSSGSPVCQKAGFLLHEVGFSGVIFRKQSYDVRIIPMTLVP
jgi:hypothetical protein